MLIWLVGQRTTSSAPNDGRLIESQNKPRSMKTPGHDHVEDESGA